MEYEARYNPNDEYWYIYNTKTNEYIDIKSRNEEVINRYAYEMSCG